MRLAILMVAALALAACTDAPAAPRDDAGPTAEPAAATLPTVDVDDFLADFEHMVTTYPDRADNVPTHIAVRDFYADTFESYGMDVWRHNFTTDIDQQNVVGIQWGKNRDQWVVIGGHYDTFSIDCIAGPTCAGRLISQGAYDDGSGTAMTLYMAKLFQGMQPNCTIAYMLFDGEERGLQGSAAIAGLLSEGSTPYGPVVLRAVIDIDMFGITWPSVQTPIEFSHSSDAMMHLVEAARIELGVPDNMISYSDARASGGSDFANFADWAPTGFFSSDMGQEGIPGSGLVPAPVPSVPGVYPFWHQVDRWETMMAMAGGPQGLADGFNTANVVVAALLYGLAYTDVPVDLAA